MKILHLANTPLSGSPYRLMKIQNKNGHYARLISRFNKYGEYTRMEYPSDILLRHDGTPQKHQLFDKDLIFSLFKECDVIFLHNFVEQFVFRYFPELQNYLKTKHVVFMVHSPRDSLEGINRAMTDQRIDRRLVVAQFQARQFQECIPVPNAIDIYEPIYMPKENPNTKPHIVYSPSNKVLKGWNDKGFRDTSAALKWLNLEECSYDIVVDTPHLSCIKRKRKGDIAIDEVITGSYHLCTLEGLSHGQAVLCNMDKTCEQTVLKAVGAVPPVIRTDAKTLKYELYKLIKEPERLELYQVAAREYMKEYWNPESIDKKYMEAIC